MKNLAFYTQYAIRSLRRGGQRTFLALVCIAFGVMSLVAMQSLSNLFLNTLLADPAARLGGDMLVTNNSDPLTGDQLAKLDQLKASGAIRAYTLRTDGELALLKPTGSGHAYMLNNEGVDLATYPLVGKFQFQDGSTSLSELLKDPNSAILTRDVTDLLNLKVGDSLTLIDPSKGTHADLHLTGIAMSTPTSQGGDLVYSLQTALQMSNGQFTPNAANVILGNPSTDIMTELKTAGFDVQKASSLKDDPNAAATANLFDFMFKAAGILGLIIGGIGVANTLQVLLARRQTEIAVLKTLGYQESDLLLLFGIETGLMGLIGCFVGAVAAIGLSALLVGQFMRTIALLVNWSIDPKLLVSGMLAGFATTLVFGTYAIIRASSVRPAMLLRNLPTMRSVSAWVGTFGLILLLAVLYGVVCTLIMGSISEGISVVGGAIIGFIVLGILFGVILFILIRFPMPKIGILTLARNSLKRQQIRAVYALIALFAGVFTIGFAAMVISSASDRFAGHHISTSGDNLLVYANSATLPQISDQLTAGGATASQIRYEVPVKIGTSTTSIILQGRDSSPTDLTLSGAEWGSSPDGAYLPFRFPGMNVGDSITVTSANGTTQTVKIVGTYQPKGLDLLSLQTQQGRVLVSKDVALTLGGTSTAISVVAAIPVNQLATVSDSLGRSVPSATIINLADIDDFLNRVFKNLFTLAVAVAGLALVAGAVLIANSVGLAMVERRRELGILKSIGYSSNRVLSMVMLEQGLLGLIGGLIGIAAVWLAIRVLDTLQPKALLTFNTSDGGIMIGVAIVIALASAALVASHPARSRPLDVLRDE